MFMKMYSKDTEFVILEEKTTSKIRNKIPTYKRYFLYMFNFPNYQEVPICEIMIHEVLWEKMLTMRTALVKTIT